MKLLLEIQCDIQHHSVNGDLQFLWI